MYLWLINYILDFSISEVGSLIFYFVYLTEYCYCRHCILSGICILFQVWDPSSFSVFNPSFFILTVQFSYSRLVVIGIILPHYYITYLYVCYYIILLSIYIAHEIVLLYYYEWLYYIIIISYVIMLSHSIITCCMLLSYITLLLEYISISICIVYIWY